MFVFLIIVVCIDPQSLQHDSMTVCIDPQSLQQLWNTMVVQYIDPHSLWHDSLRKLQKCSTDGYVMWTFFNGATCLNLHGWIVTPISSDEPWIFFFFFCFILSWSSQTICLHEDFMLPISSILCSPSLHPLVKTTIWCIFALGYFLSAPSPSSLRQNHIIA